MRLTAAELARAVGGEVVGDPEAVVTGAEVDSRRVAPGGLFVALPGENTDGHRFVADALCTGTAALVRRDVDLRPPPPGRAHVRVADPLVAYHLLAAVKRRKRPWRVAALTGSVGKTTTKEILAALLAARFRVGASAGNRNSILGLPAQLLSQPPEVEVFVAEAGMSRPGELDTLGGILRPDLLLYTRLGEVHSEFFGGMDGIVAAKGELLPHLSGDGTLIVNADDPHQADYPRCVPRSIRVLRHGPGGDVAAHDVISEGLLGSRFRLVLPDEEAEVRIRLAGAHQVENLVAAAAAAAALGVAAAEIAAAASALDAPPHRGQVRVTTDGVTVVDDSYNASPLAVRRALDLLRSTSGRRIAVLGEMRELSRAAGWHREIDRKSVV